ncbi:heparinase II/III domain-containing protein [Metabacillus sp. RGM 3146]|uniref:heparinase II/III domain-containing protein n=1 Tax=Metabacillus sp. RGM 3146 TaxID=3401092 RepID=UPI003B9BA760
MSASRLEVLDLSVIETGEKAEVKIFPSLLKENVNVRSTHPEVASFSEGFLIGHKNGTTVITVSNGEQQIQKKVNVLPNEKTIYESASIERPSILFTANELKKIQSNKGKNRQDWDAFLGKANTYREEKEFLVTYGNAPNQLLITIPLKQPEWIKSPEGFIDYPYWTMLSRAVEERIRVLSLAFLLTGVLSYALKVKEYLLSLSTFTRWYEYPSRAAEGNLSNAHFLMAAGIGYDSVFLILTARERKIIRNTILTHGLRPLAADLHNQDRHNIICSKQCALLVGTLSVWGELPYIEKYVTRAASYIKDYLDERFLAEETEGLLYTAAAAKHILFASAVYLRVLKIDSLIKHPYLSEILPKLFLVFMAPGKDTSFANFSDANYSIDIASMMGQLSYYNDNQAVSWFMEEHAGGYDESFLFQKDEIEPLSPEKVYKNHYIHVFQSIGWASMRSGWGENDHMLALCSSPSDRDHNHFDQNHFIVNIGGEWLITDPGYQDYVPGPKNQYTLGSIGHNTLLINGEGQSSRGGGGIHWNGTNSKMAILQAEAGKSYSGRVCTFTRTVIYHFSGCYFICDHIEKRNAADQASLLFHSQSSFWNHAGKLEKPGKIHDHFLTITGESHSLDIHFPQKRPAFLRKFAGANEEEYCLEVYAEEELLTILVPRIAHQPSPFVFDFHETESEGIITIHHLKEGWAEKLAFPYSQEALKREYQRKTGYEFSSKEKGGEGI